MAIPSLTQLAQSGIARDRGSIMTTLGGLAIFLIMAVNSLTLFTNYETVTTHRRQVLHTTEIIESLDQIQTAVVSAEAGERGYLITGMQDYLEPYHAARADTLAEIARFRDLTQDNPGQQAHIPALEAAVKAIFDRFDLVISVSHGRIEEARKLVGSGIGERLVADCLAIVRQMKRREQETMREQTKIVNRSAQSVKDAVVFSTAVNLLMLATAFILIKRFLKQLRSDQKRLASEAWLKNGFAQLNERIRAQQLVSGITRTTLDFLAEYVGIRVGSFYVLKDSRLTAVASFGSDTSFAPKETIKLGETLVGEVAISRSLMHLKDVPSDYMRVSSSLGAVSPREIVIFPVLNDNELEGVIELGSLNAFSDLDFQLFEYIKEKLGVAIDSAQSRAHLQYLLEETQAQSEELQSHQEELRASNEELETQTSTLKYSQERLQLQQEELRQSNEELEQQAKVLEQQKQTLTDKNSDLQDAQREIERKAVELARASQYKSEFLANMSHELRTPLNSMLILSTLLFENESKNLSEKQVGFAKTIYRSGNDLLILINDILDLAKVESGKFSLNIESVDLKQVVTELDESFRCLAEEKNIEFNIHIEDDTPQTVQSDRQRIEQVIRNFLSNAVKFTSQGSIDLTLAKPKANVELRGGRRAVLEFIVKDTGIGISRDKQDLIFEAFQQADGSTSREYGGTGLGLTISRELANLLGGRIEMSSSPGLGSTFSLLLPQEAPVETESRITGTIETIDQSARDRDRIIAAATVHQGVERSVTARPFNVVGDTGVKDGDRVILIIEDDAEFGRILLEQAHESGFKAIVALDGESGLAILERYFVRGVVLDLRLPDISGMTVLERIKTNPKYRHLPIHVISGSDNSQNALKMGAVGYLVKPVTRNQLSEAFSRIEKTMEKSIKRVLVVEDDVVQREAINLLLRGADVIIDTVGTGRDAERKLGEENYDCMILDLKLPDISGFDLLELLNRRDDGMKPPVVIYTGKELSAKEVDRLSEYAESIIIKGARSPERLLDEVSLFLHRVETQLSPDSQELLRNLRMKETVFEGRRILVVDDDMRNVFALSNALEMKGLKVVVGKNGRDGVEKLKSDPAIDLVLMDIMMPVMDGFEAMRTIRLMPQFKKLPIIALTAKAMIGDQEKCIEAGANDYLPKPVNIDRLLSLLRVWLPQKNEI